MSSGFCAGMGRHTRRPLSRCDLDLVGPQTSALSARQHQHWFFMMVAVFLGHWVNLYSNVGCVVCRESVINKGVYFAGLED